MIKGLLFLTLLISASEAMSPRRGKTLAHFVVQTYEKLHHIHNEMELTTEHTSKGAQFVRNIATSDDTSNAAVPLKASAMGANQLFNQRLQPHKKPAGNGHGHGHGHGHVSKPTVHKFLSRDLIHRRFISHDHIHRRSNH